MLALFWDWLFDFLPWKVQLGILSSIVVGIGLLVLWAVYG